MLYFCFPQRLSCGSQRIIVLYINRITAQSNGELELLRDLLSEIHPGCEYVMEERLHNVEQRRVTPGKGGIKIKILLLIFQEDVAEMRVAVTDDGHACPLRLEHNFCTFNQMTQCRAITLQGDPINTPAVAQQFVK